MKLLQEGGSVHCGWAWKKKAFLSPRDKLLVAHRECYGCEVIMQAFCVLGTGIRSIFPAVKLSEHAPGWAMQPWGESGQQAPLKHKFSSLNESFTSENTPSADDMSHPRLLLRWLRPGCQSSCQWSYQSFFQMPTPVATAAPLPSAGITHQHNPDSSPTRADISPPWLWYTTKCMANAAGSVGLDKQDLMVRCLQKS